MRQYADLARDRESHSKRARAEQIPKYWSNENRIQAIPRALQSSSDVPVLLQNQLNVEVAAYYLYLSLCVVWCFDDITWKMRLHDNYCAVLRMTCSVLVLRRVIASRRVPLVRVIHLTFKACLATYKYKWLPFNRTFKTKKTFVGEQNKTTHQFCLQDMFIQISRIKKSLYCICVSSFDRNKQSLSYILKWKKQEC